MLDSMQLTHTLIAPAIVSVMFFTFLFHRSLEGQPAPEEMATEPAGLKVSLFPHQRHALAWLQWREKQKPSGGILGR